MLSGISRIVQAKSRRMSSFDRSGGNEDWTPIPPVAICPNPDWVTPDVPATTLGYYP